MSQKPSNYFATASAVVGACLAFTLSSASFALPDDRLQPIDIAANSATLDEKKREAIYSGKVSLSQGSLTIDADKLIISMDDEGKVAKVVAVGNKARFSQQPKPTEQRIVATGNTIEYHLVNEKLLLKGTAHVEQSGNTFSGAIIEYDLKEQRLIAKGKAKGAESHTGKHSGRVKMVLQPQTKKPGQ